jgi:predicted MFS family arabinose efflux permease
MSASAPALPRGLPGYVTLLRDNDDVRNVWLAQVISQLGDWFNRVALLGLINQLTGNSFAAALVTTLTILPSALTSLTVGGYIADRVDRKQLAIGVDIARAVAALGPLLVGSADTLWIAYTAVALLSFGEALFSPAISAAQPNLCRSHELATANALQQSTWASVSMIGAALGGVAVIFLPREAAFLLNALSFLISAYFLWRVRGRFSQPGQRAGGVTLAALTGGAQFLWANPRIFAMSLTKAIWGIVFATEALYSVFAYQVYGSGDAGTSWLYSARGIGSFLGPVLVQSLFSPHTTRQFAAIIAGGFAIAISGYTLWALSPSPWLGALGIFAAHMGAGSLWTFSRIYVQRETPDNVRGRVMALDVVGFTLVVGVTSTLWGALANILSPAGAVLVAISVMSALVALWALWMWRNRRESAHA